jgi:hypothetical protein
MKVGLFRIFQLRCAVQFELLREVPGPPLAMLAAAFRIKAKIENPLFSTT